MYPSVSITIPCRNEEKYIQKCIESILHSDYPKEKITIYVCDGMSTDSTGEIIRKIIIKHPNIQLLDNTKQTTPFALNLGLQASNADVKIILGAHATIDKSFISKNIEILNEFEEVGCAGGIIENVYETETAKTIGLAMSSSFGVGNAHFRTGNKNGFVDTVAFGAYRKEVFDKIGYFDDELVRNQDDEFNFRLLKNDFKIYLSSEIKSKYYVRASFKKLFRQYYQYGYWKVYVNKKHQALTTIRQLIPLFFVLYISIGGIVSTFSLIILFLYLAGLLSYIGLAIYFALKKTNYLSQVFEVVYTFLILHISYGVGYLVGIFDFMLLNKKPSKKNTELSR